MKGIISVAGLTACQVTDMIPVLPGLSFIASGQRQLVGLLAKANLDLLKVLMRSED